MEKTNFDNFCLTYLTSKNGEKTCSLDGVFIHSRYSPQEDEREFILRNKEKILSSKYLIVLGSGLGYHLEHLDKLCETERHMINVLVIDPIAEFREYSYEPKFIKISYRFGVTTDSVFNDKLVLDFLSLKPSVLAHIGSINASKLFFEQFLTHKRQDEELDYNLLIKNLLGNEHQLSKSERLSALSQLAFKSIISTGRGA